MSNSQQAPPDSWDMDPNETPNNADSSVTPGLSAMSLNINAPAFVPNVNAPAFVPGAVRTVPPAQVSPAPSGVQMPQNSATSTQNGKIIKSKSLVYIKGTLTKQFLKFVVNHIPLTYRYFTSQPC